MKSHRLLSILLSLTNSDKVTAKDLANKLEVSKRTIYRDIEELCMSGIPITTFQGGNGGISIAEGYKLDKSLLTTDELDDVVIGLNAIGSIWEGEKMNYLVEKFTSKQQELLSISKSVVIDLASFEHSELKENILLFRTAIKNKSEVHFHYFTENGKTERTIEPYIIVFTWGKWYVWGFCSLRNDFRTFKLTRMLSVKATDKTFIPREEHINNGWHFNTHEQRKGYITLLADPSFEYKIFDVVGINSNTVLENGKLRFELPYLDFNTAIETILSFGDKVTVISPQMAVDEILLRTKNILKRYK